MFTRKNVIRACFAAVVTLGLAACGGGSSDEMPDPPDPGPAQMAASEAAAAAKTASDAAAAAVAAVADIKNSDASSHALAQLAVNDAMDAYMDAKAASEKAAAATTLADAEMYQQAAEDAQAEAEAAQGKAVMYAGMVTTAHQTAEDERMAAEAEAKALSDAQMAAMTAAVAAKTASDAAASVVEAQAANAGADQASYDEAATAARTAMDAYMDAKTASEAAANADTSADAEAQKTIAETKRGEAEAALVDARMYAGMVADAKVEADADAAETEALNTAKMAAMTAATEADKASTSASEAVDAQRANKDLSTIAAANFARAEDAAADAAKASGDAAMANNAAQAAMTSEDAEMYQKQAEDAQRAAELAQNNAETFAGMVATVKQNMDDAAKEKSMLAAAKTAAEEAAKAAEEAAKAAEEAADMAEADAPGSSDAKRARKAATDARTAADMAETENIKAQAATDSETAMAAQAEAEAQQNIADDKQDMAEAARDDAADARIAAETLQEKRDLAAAKQAVEALYSDTADGILFHYNAVVSKAGEAATHASNARDHANQAMRARTNYAKANEYAEDAEEADAKAQASLGRAMTAKGEADAARQDAMDATTSTDAKAALTALQMANAALIDEHTGAMGAGMNYMEARDAAEKARGSLRMHVISLLMHANAQDLELGNPDDIDLAAAVARAKKARLKDVSDVINAAAGMHSEVLTELGDRDQNSSTTDTTDSTATATASWLGRNVDDPTTSTDESTMPTLSITVSIDSATSLEWRTEAAEEDDANTIGLDETIVTATKLNPGLGRFGNGYEIHGYEISDRGNHAIVFTDKRPGTDQVLAVTAVTARYVEDEVVNAAAELSLGNDKTGPTFTGVTWTPSNQQPLTGTLSCGELDSANCDIQVNADGTVNTIGGYVFTGSRDAVAGVDPAGAMQDEDYLAFGIWLREDTNGETTAGTPKAFAAFANGGEPIASFAAYTALTSTAEYKGRATGVHTKGSSVDYFEGNASLTADFGAIDTDAERDSSPPADTTVGTISGMISGIVAGGVSTGDVIRLREADIVDTNSAFSGNARMGDGDIQDDDTVKYPYNGTWSGNFYGPNPAIPDDNGTADVDESMDAAAPDAVAGTFGVSGTMGEGDDAVTSTYVGAFGARRP